MKIYNPYCALGKTNDLSRKQQNEQTYENRNTLPEGFKLRLSEFDLPENLQHSLAEVAPAEDLSERAVPVPEEFEIIIPEFDVSKKINIFRNVLKTTYNIFCMFVRHRSNGQSRVIIGQSVAK